MKQIDIPRYRKNNSSKDRENKNNNTNFKANTKKIYDALRFTERNDPIF